MSIRANVPAQRLDQRITFQRKVNGTQNPVNGEIPVSWQDVITCWGCVDAIRANERHISDQIEAEGDYTVWVRWRGDLDANMRIVWRGTPLDIKSIPDQQRRGRWLAIFCESGLNQG